MRRIFVTFSLMLFFAGGANAATDKPNILIVWGDDIGWFNTSAYNRGMMGYQTHNIDRIANEGALFTDHYGHPSCTAGRAAFITGMYPIRSTRPVNRQTRPPIREAAREASMPACPPPTTRTSTCMFHRIRLRAS